MAKDLAKVFGAESAESGHPDNGKRRVPDELAEIVANLIAPTGRQPCKWLHGEFAEVVNDHMQEPPCLLATNGGLKFTGEFPFGNRPSNHPIHGRESSLFRGSGCDPHPRYGNGLLLIQSFRAGDMSEEEGIGLAFSLNTEELTKNPVGYGFGSYCYNEGCIHFTTFLPNAVHRYGLLPSLYWAGASRAWYMSKVLTDVGS